MGRKCVEVMASFDRKGKPTPIRVRMEGAEEESIILKVDRILRTDGDRTAGNLMLRFFCETHIEGVAVPFELRYETATLCWFIYGE